MKAKHCDFNIFIIFTHTNLTRTHMSDTGGGPSQGRSSTCRQNKALTCRQKKEIAKAKMKAEMEADSGRPLTFWQKREISKAVMAMRRAEREAATEKRSRGLVLWGDGEWISKEEAGRRRGELGNLGKAKRMDARIDEALAAARRSADAGLGPPLFRREKRKIAEAILAKSKAETEAARQAARKTNKEKRSKGLVLWGEAKRVGAAMCPASVRVATDVAAVAKRITKADLRRDQESGKPKGGITAWTCPGCSDFACMAGRVGRWLFDTSNLSILKWLVAHHLIQTKCGSSECKGTHARPVSHPSEPKQAAMYCPTCRQTLKVGT